MSLVQQVPADLLCYVFLAFLAKHFIADFLLQTGWMAHGKEQATGWLLPLSAHSAIHGIITTVLCLFFAPAYVWLGPVDFVVHFAIDRGKAVATRTLGAGPSQSEFWWLLGLDQSLHHLTHFCFVLLITTA